jgi:hypothetical protein
MEPVVTQAGRIIALPFTNPELAELREGLIAHHTQYDTWPRDSTELAHFISHKDSLNLWFGYYHFLEWTDVNDTLKVNFELRYPPVDSFEYQLIQGKLDLFLNNDRKLIYYWQPTKVVYNDEQRN